MRFAILIQLFKELSKSKRLIPSDLIVTTSCRDIHLLTFSPLVSFLLTRTFFTASPAFNKTKTNLFVWECKGKNYFLIGKIKNNLFFILLKIRKPAAYSPLLPLIRILFFRTRTISTGLFSKEPVVLFGRTKVRIFSEPTKYFR